MDGSICTSSENNLLQTPNLLPSSSVQKICVTPCELCKSPASLYCSADEARLCFDCDARIHSANFLVARHTRCLLCPLCGSSSSGSASIGPRFKLPPFQLRICSTCSSNVNQSSGESITVAVPANVFPLRNCYPWDHDEESRVCSSDSSSENSQSHGYGEDEDAFEEVASSHKHSTIASTSSPSVPSEHNRKRIIPISFQCWWSEGVGDSEEDDSVRHSFECSSQEVSTVLKEDKDLGFNTKNGKRQRV